MSEELKIFDLSEEELKSLYTKYSTDFLGSSQSQNVKRDIANLAHNELVRRSNNQYAKKSTILTYVVLILSVIAVIFASLDYKEDNEWQSEQIKQLEEINKNLINQRDGLKNQNTLIQNELKSLNEKTTLMELELKKVIKKQ